MGRAGSGSHSGGGGSFGGGHHSGGSVSGGHHVGGGGSGHRAGSGWGSGLGGGFRPGGGFGGGMRDPGFGGPPGGGFHPHPGPGFGGPGFPPPGPRLQRRNNGRGSGCLTVFLVLFVVCFLLSILGGGESTVESTIVRTKLTDSHSYDSSDVADDLGWFDSVSDTESRLKDFYDATGVQPYVYLRAYDSSLTSDAEKESWAKDFFDNTLQDEDGFLFVYFAEEDQDEDVGYMAYVAGSRAQSVMDSEAVDIFWSYIDRYWTTDKSTDDVICLSFTNTADAIMHVSTTQADLSKYLLLAIIVVGGGAVIFLIIREKNRRAHEKAKETESILNTPLEQAVNSAAEKKQADVTEKSTADDLIDHYTKS